MINILTMDGGPGPLVGLYAMLHEDAEPLRRYVGQVDVFAGTSDGALIALYLAMRLGDLEPTNDAGRRDLDVQDIIADCIRFTDRYTAAIHADVKHLATSLVATGNLLELAMAAGKKAGERLPFARGKLRELRENGRAALGIPADLWSMRRFLAGQEPAMGREELRDVLEDVFKGRTLGSLRKEVVVMSFDTQEWSPRVFRSFWADDPEGQADRARDEDTLLVDVALCTSSFPLLLPMFGGPRNSKPRGYLDGVFAANNPAMAAVSMAARHLVPATEEDALEQLSVLSLGAAQTAEEANLERSGGALALLSLLAVDDRDARMFLMPMTPTARLKYLLSPEVRERMHRDLRVRGVGEAAWGWLRFIERPTFIANLLVHGMNRETSRQCKRLLGDDFFRFNPRINLVRAMYRLMCLRRAGRETDLEWNAKRCFEEQFSNLPPSADELHNAKETKELLGWLRGRPARDEVEAPLPAPLPAEPTAPAATQP